MPPVSPIHDKPPEKRKLAPAAGPANRAELSSSVLELGQRARQRLEEQRSKRPEIVVLTTQPSPVPPTRQPKPAAFTRTASSAPPTQLTIEPRAQKEKSSVLRVDGLPEHCTPEMIRRFFSGFEPDRIVVLPTLDLEIAEWGESVAPNERVLVKFPSGPIALAASQRSYEYILHGGGDKSVIKLSLVTKLTGNYLLQNLGIDSISGQSLTTTRENTEANTQPCILHLLWTLAIRELHLDAEEWVEDSSYPWKQRVSDFYDNLSNLEAYRESLSQELDRMERSGAILQLHVGDPQVLLFDPVVRFYDTACKRLHLEIAEATNLLIMARYENQRTSTL